MIVTCMYDRVAKQYGTPQVYVNKGVAVRDFNNKLASVPFKDDIDLYAVGTFDGETGSLVGLDKPEFICHYSQEVANE